MAVLEVVGGKILQGEVRLSGAKNASLPILLGSLMCDGIVELENVPTLLEDIKVAIQIMRRLGAKVTVKGTRVTVDPSGCTETEVPAVLASRVRSSLLMLSILLTRLGKVHIPIPGGCEIGARKFDWQIKNLQDLGARIEVYERGIRGEIDHFKGADVDFYSPTTTGTENVMLAASRAHGKTRIRNAHTPPEIMDFAEFLNSAGAQIRVASRFIEIEGVKGLHGTRYKIMSGNDEAVTYMIAAGMTGGEIVIKDYNLRTLRSESQYLREAGMEVFEWGGAVYVSGRKGIHPFDMFTAPYPGVNSDMQPLFTALALAAPGESTVTDQVFTERFAYIKELKMLGADAEQYGNSAVVHGGKKLKGGKVRAPDIRGGAAIILAALAAEGKTTIENEYQIDRGYERIESKMGKLGALITRRA